MPLTSLPWDTAQDGCPILYATNPDMDQAARSSLTRALAGSESLRTTMHDLAVAMALAGLRERAHGLLRMIMSPARALNNLGALAEYQGRKKEALDLYDKSLKCDPALPEARANHKRLAGDQAREVVAFPARPGQAIAHRLKKGDQRGNQTTGPHSQGRNRGRGQLAHGVVQERVCPVFRGKVGYTH